MTQHTESNRWMWIVFFVLGYIVGTGSVVENVYHVFCEMSVRQKLKAILVSTVTSIALSFSFAIILPLRRLARSELESSKYLIQNHEDHINIITSTQPFRLYNNA
ncbi:hypothetical protein AKO1_014746 [Acrasis kona]|uniref:Uncharacterized protein n=1 Tax=Acrasis kona TaxID=1008807 RepID=A0AAW2Z2Y8_9EUKA